MNLYHFSAPHKWMDYTEIHCIVREASQEAALSRLERDDPIWRQKTTFHGSPETVDPDECFRGREGAAMLKVWEI